MTSSQASYPLVKRFKDVKSLSSTLMLLEDEEIYGKFFREGTVFLVLGWREVQNIPYLVINKGSWEALVEYSWFLSITTSLE